MSENQTQTNRRVSIRKDAPVPLPRKSFSSEDPYHQLAWDNTSLAALKNCPRYYYYAIVLGYVGKLENVHFRFGIMYNDSLGAYYKGIALGEDHETAMMRAVRFALTASWNEELGRPWSSDETTKTRETLVRSVIWYLDTFENDPMQTKILANGKPAIELSFSISIDLHSGLTGEQYSMCGYLDRQVEFMDADWIPDFKTTKYQLDENYFAQYTPNNQVSQYSFAGKIILDTPINGVIIDAAQLGVTFTRFRRQHIPRPDAVLEEWLRDAKFYIEQNEKFIADRYWPMNDTACHKYMGCIFRKICGMSPEVRQIHLDASFERRLWDPLVVREL